MGKIIYVCGPYGAGKTTLVGEARKSIPSLKAIPTYTTRKPRTGELENSIDQLIFVSNKEYEDLRKKSQLWDHTEILGIYYGADTQKVNEDLESGANYIITAPSDVHLLEDVRSKYRADNIVIWVDTNLDIANKRLLKRDGNEAKLRINSPTQNIEYIGYAREHADYIFSPSNNLKQDASKFIQLIKSVLYKNEGNP